MRRTLFVSFLALSLFLGNTAHAANDGTPCPVIGGVQTYEQIPNSKCNFPNGSFGIGAPGAAKAQADLVAWNTLHRTTSQGGVQDGGGTGPANIDDHIPKSPESQISKECANASFGILDPGLGKALCYLGGQVMSMLDALFSLENIFWLLSVITYITFRLSNVMLGLATWWLDGAVYYTVVLMGAYIAQDGTAQGIKFAWGIIRDIANIAIIGGFVAVGISTILNISQYAADKFLARLIIAALLVNFSYFIAGAIIDASNYVSTQIYFSDILTAGCDKEVQVSTVGSIVNPATGLGLLSGHTKICSIGSSFMKHSNLSSWDKIQGIARNSIGEGPNTTNSDNTSTSGLKGDQKKNLYFSLMMMGFLGTIFNLVAGFVFIMAAGLLVVRFAALILVLITSPIGVAGVNVPYIGQYVGRWWQVLGSQAAFAPVYFILVGVGLLVMKSFAAFLSSAAGGKSFADALSANSAEIGQGTLTGYLPLFIIYFVGIAFMYLALMFARQIASSVPELKGFYDASQNYMWSAYLAPAKLGQMGAGLALSPIGAGLERIAASGRPGSMRERLFGGASTGIRAFSKIGVKQKDDAKSSSEETKESIIDRRKNRYARDPRTMFGTSGQQPALSLQKTGVLYKDEKDRTPEEQHGLEEDIANIEKGAVLDTLGFEGVRRALKEGLLSDEQKQEVFGSKQISSSQKSSLRDTLFGSFNKALDAAKNGTGSWSDVNDELDKLTEVDKQILYTNRRDLKADEQFLGALSAKNFDAVVKQSSPSEHKDLKVARTNGIGAELTRPKGAKETDEQYEKRIKGTLDRMSDDDVRRLKPEHVTDEVIRRMKPSQRRVRYENSQDEAEQKRIEAIDPNVKGPSLRQKEPEKPAEEPKPAADKK